VACFGSSNLDMLVASCITATLLAAVHAALSHEQGGRWRGALAVAFGCAALGLLAKGLIGVVLPGAVHAIWCLVTRWPQALTLGAWLPGWIVLLAVAAPWFVGMQRRYPGFFDYFVVTQHFRRFAASGFNNVNPFWFYVPVIFGLTLPWAGWMAVGAWKRRRDARTTVQRLSDIDWLMLVWFVAIVAFFSVLRSKLVGYVLPALPPLARFVYRS